MWKLVGLLAIIMAAYTASAFTIQAVDFPVAEVPDPVMYEYNSNCPCSGYNIYAQLGDCIKCGDCKLKKGTTVPVKAGLTSHYNMSAMNFQYDVRYLGLITVYQGDKNYPEPCYADQPYVYNDKLDLPADAPSGKYTVTLKVSSPEYPNYPVACIFNCVLEVY